MNKKLTGAFIPVITPFTDQKGIWAKLAHNIEKADRRPSPAICLLGAPVIAHMNDEEQLSLLRTIK
jgi:4-hydroxy-2-oxoglutarate aldolase